MSRTKPFLIGLVIGVSFSFIALRYHVVRYNEGFMLVPRTDQPPVRSAYADVREWGSAMWKQYPEVAAALVKDGHSKLVADSMTGGLLGRLETDDAEPLELLLDDEPVTPARPASTVRKNPPTPIRVAPTGTERPTAPARPVRLSQPVDDADRQVSVNGVRSRVGASGGLRPPLAGSDEASGRVRSALESLFAPYDAASGQTSIPASPEGAAVNMKSSIPAGSAAPARILDLQDLEIDLGPAQQVIPSSPTPRQAATTGLFSPRRIDDAAAKIAVSPVGDVPQTANSTGSTHQFPLK